MSFTSPSLPDILNLSTLPHCGLYHQHGLYASFQPYTRQRDNRSLTLTDTGNVAVTQTERSPCTMEREEEMWAIRKPKHIKLQVGIISGIARGFAVHIPMISPI